MCVCDDGDISQKVKWKSCMLSQYYPAIISLDWRNTNVLPTQSHDRMYVNLQRSSADVLVSSVHGQLRIINRVPTKRWYA